MPARYDSNLAWRYGQVCIGPNDDVAVYANRPRLAVSAIRRVSITFPAIKNALGVSRGR
jgi:hypothetical protein